MVVHISTAGGGMWASMPERCSSFIRSRISPRISQTLSPSNGPERVPRDHAPLLLGHVRGTEGKQLLLLVVEVLFQAPTQGSQALRTRIFGGGVTGRPPLEQPDRLGDELVDVAVLAGNSVDQFELACASLAQQRKDESLLAVMVHVQERDHVAVEARDELRRSGSSSPTSSTRRGAADSVSRSALWTGYMSLTSMPSAFSAMVVPPAQRGIGSDRIRPLIGHRCVSPASGQGAGKRLPDPDPGGYVPRRTPANWVPWATRRPLRSQTKHASSTRLPWMSWARCRIRTGPGRWQGTDIDGHLQGGDPAGEFDVEGGRREGVDGEEECMPGRRPLLRVAEAIPATRLDRPASDRRSRSTPARDGPRPAP